VLVTGAGGFIGSHLVEKLVALGARTSALVRYNSRGERGWLDSSPVRGDVQVFLGDVTDPGTLKPAMKGVNVLFHLAALIGIPYSYQGPLSYVRTNIEGTLNVLQVAREAEVGLVIHTSTSEVYGTALKVPMPEDHPLQGQSPYAATKIGADKLAEAFCRSYGLPVATIRPFNTYGPRQSARAVIPTIIVQAFTQPVIRLGNLEAMRDLSYVADVVEGFVGVAETPEAVGKVTNVGSGREVSVRAVAAQVLKLMNRQRDIVVDEERVRPPDSEVERLCADITRAREMLNWQPHYTLESGLTLTIEWMEQNIGRYRPEQYAI